ncbi:cell wall-binding repeat-containing protein [Clostridium lundense]|uniref:cell wall-binding repeat-containing protein n=1 Tax=Clostridium lundense TaxID=319475 RepID=UPI000480F70B|nr:cell wall-binding repeat-containing protein [Clostridium lundense]
MSKRSHKALASATVMSLILTSTLTATNVQAAATVERAGGSDRLATAQEVAKQIFGKAETVVLVNGYGYADAVSATPLAKALNAPILLTNDAEKPSADLLASLTSLEAKKVVIVGGTGVVKTALETELAKSFTVERISGSNRYATNANVAKKVLELTKATKGVLVSAAGYADALSVASIAAAKGMPVLFGNAAEVPAEVKEAAKGLQLVAVGGAGVLPDSVISSVSATRIANGADRFDTNLKVLDYFKEDLKDVKNIFMAAGGRSGDRNFADALVASAAAAKYGAPVVLTGYGANDTQVSAATKYVKDHMKDDTKVTIVGGEASVSKDIENDVKGEKTDNKTEVGSMEALNLNQVKVVFDSKVDEDTAESVANYEIDGEQLNSDKAVADLQDDGRTVIITLARVESQEKTKTIKVRKGILSEDRSKLVPEAEKKVTFKDTSAPTVKSVSAKGNSKLTVEFSEAVFAEGSTEEAAVKTLAQQLEVNGETIDSIGYNTDMKDGKLLYTKLKNSIKASNGTAGYYVNKVEFYFDSALEDGDNKLKAPEGKKDSYLVDAAGWIMKESTTEFKVEKVTGRPQVKSVTGSTDGKVYINFDRPMDKKTASDVKNFQLNGSDLSGTDVKAETKEGDTQIKLSGVEKILTGSNTVTILDKVKDAYGNKVDDNTRVSFTAEKDSVKPKVNYVLTVDDSTIRVIFSKDVKKSVAQNTSNYTLKDSKGNKVSIEEPKQVAGCDDMYDITLKDGKKLGGSKYTLKIENIIDLAGNIMDEATFPINGSDVVPTIKKVVTVKGEKNRHKAVVIFDQEMKVSTINKLESYKYKDADDKVKVLPSDSKISVASDNKTVTIEFPEDSYKVLTPDTNTSKSNTVKSIIITKDVESINGVKMDADETVKIQEADSKSTVNLASDPVTLKDNDGGDDAIVQLRFDGAVDKVESKTSFTFVDGSKEDAVPGRAVPTSVTARGEIVEFRFTDKDAELVKAFGVDLKMDTQGTIRDYAGQPIDFTSPTKVDTNEIAPRLSYAKSNDYIKINEQDEFKTWFTDADQDTVTIKFNTKIDPYSINKDDFTFVSNSQSKLKVAGHPIVKGNTVTYEFEEDIKINEEITIKVADSQNIKSDEDDNGDKVKYVPQSAEKGEGLKFKVVKGTLVNAEKVTVEGPKEVVIGQNITLKATVTPDNATDKTVTWTSKNKDIATVDENGKVTGVKEGTAIIVAKSGDAECQYTVSVNKAVTDKDIADKVTAAITELPAVDKLTVADKDKVVAARAAYDKLTDAQKKLVTNLTVLEAAEKKIADLEKPTTPTEVTATVVKTEKNVPMLGSTKVYVKLNGATDLTKYTVTIKGENATLEGDMFSAAVVGTFEVSEIVVASDVVVTPVK